MTAIPGSERDFAPLDALLDGSDLRGFYGGYVLRPESLEKYSRGKISFEYLNEEVKPNNSSLLFWANSKCKKINELYLRARLLHSETHFSEFAFDIIALLKGTYRPYALSSMYGFGTSDLEKGGAVSITYANPEDVKRFDEETERLLRDMLKENSSGDIRTE